MSDQETNQLLRELLQVQKEQLELLRKSERLTEDSNRAYRETDALYKEHMTAKPWELAVRIVTPVSLITLLAYLVLR